jgi:hypothetical protein
VEVGLWRGQGVRKELEFRPLREGGEVDRFVLFGKGRHLTMSHALLGTCPGSEYSIRVN